MKFKIKLNSIHNNKNNNNRQHDELPLELAAPEQCANEHCDGIISFPLSSYIVGSAICGSYEKANRKNNKFLSFI